MITPTNAAPLMTRLGLGRVSDARSDSYIIVTSSSKDIFGAHPSFSRALEASPMSRSTSAGRSKRGSFRT